MGDCIWRGKETINHLIMRVKEKEKKKTGGEEHEEGAEGTHETGEERIG